jgi:N-acetylglucosaminyldiphosphoundecaprenol N-acetyl-beta-D-mannosaminyltransferase
MPSRPFDRVNVLGVGISAINMELALAAIDRALAERRKGYICLADVRSVMEAQRDEGLRHIFNRSFLTTPDGMPLVWASHLAGFGHVSRVYGPDLMLALCEQSRHEGYTHFLFGGQDATMLEQLQRRLELRFPGIRIVGRYVPPFRPLAAEEEAELGRQVAAAKPDILWVGISTPKQEHFMARYLERLDATLFIGVGAAFDFHVGRVRQAPRWVQRSGFEWLFRLACEPRRLARRYLVNVPWFLGESLLQIARLKHHDIEP